MIYTSKFKQEIVTHKLRVCLPSSAASKAQWSDQAVRWQLKDIGWIPTQGSIVDEFSQLFPAGILTFVSDFQKSVKAYH